MPMRAPASRRDVAPPGAEKPVYPILNRFVPRKVERRERGRASTSLGTNGGWGFTDRCRRQQALAGRRSRRFVQRSRTRAAVLAA